jgi:NhaP-type Na+/H+ or K+/H+ antiporter
MLELAGIIILGIFAQWLAWRIKVPAILPLIIIGLLVGPISSLVTADGQKLLEPIQDDNGGIFPSKYLFAFVSLAIGIILFEGGLTLKRREIAGVGPVILKLTTVGSLVTFIGAGLASHFVMGLTWPIAFLFGGLIIVTGPTVIAPILQNVPLNRNIATVLKWEGILIDPIGALVAVLVFEFIRSSEGGISFTSHALVQFTQVILIGLALGTLAALALYQLIKYDLIPHYLLNVFTLALVLSDFVVSDLLAHESGLLSVVVMGTILGNLDVPRLKDILYFKESLSVLLISILFILLAASMDIADLAIVFNDWRSLLLFGIVALVLRPLGVFLSTHKSELSFNEKIFISWVGPRGIVAAGIASLFGITLANDGVPGAEYITPLVFMIVLGTVLLNATTARLVARLLKVTQETSEGILFIGANTAARTIALYLKENNRHVVLIDNNPGSIEKAKQQGLEAFAINIYTDDLADYFELLDMGYLIAMTSSGEVNNYAVSKYQNIFGENGTFRLITAEEMNKPISDLPDQGIFSYTDDFLNISEVARDYPHIHEADIQDIEHLKQMVKVASQDLKVAPIFTKNKSGELQLLPSNVEDIVLEPEMKLVYMGKTMQDSLLGIDATEDSSPS